MLLVRSPLMVCDISENNTTGTYRESHVAAAGSVVEPGKNKNGWSLPEITCYIERQEKWCHGC